MNTSVIIEPATGRRRRRHSDEFKAEVIRACRHPGVSIAAVALANGLNANLVRRWVANAERDTQLVIEAAPLSPAAIKGTPGQVPAFLPLQLAAPTIESPPEIQIELCRGGTTVKVTWPTSAASECASWMRELLR